MKIILGALGHYLILTTKRAYHSLFITVDKRVVSLRVSKLRGEKTAQP